MFTNEMVNYEVQRYRMLVRFKVFTVSERFTPESFQFLPDGQER